MMDTLCMVVAREANLHPQEESVEQMAFRIICARCKEILDGYPTTLKKDEEMLRGDGEFSNPLSAYSRLAIQFRTTRKVLLTAYARSLDEVNYAN
ncbi:hypothetical protein CYMTET_25987 [Cymbomonas tetramitiformis]|uniref:Rubisco LSMT substrate-binding domain-containing protein n=1 Tax=Cymbomonas tetramitiformis TaxID=36881 RepID=A0AAE0KYD6_9CHLO|nr:hypothetical protein CYMTET_25987 [Cymbomonas tetramitiformis]